jgi:hypothetical protein
MHARALLTLLALAGCTEYEFVPEKEENPPNEEEETGAPVGEDSGEITTEDCPPAETEATSVVIDETCLIEAEPGGFTPVLEWYAPGFGAAYVTPVVANLTDDNVNGIIDSEDIPDVALISTSGQITVMSGDGITTHWTAYAPGSEPGTLAIGDLDNDGFAEVVASTSDGRVHAYHGEDGTVLWEVSTPLGTIPVCGGISIYDLDGDGFAEVVQGNVILNGQTGAVRGVGSYGRGTGYGGGYYAAFGVAADIDQDGDLEVVTGNALYDADGNTIWYNGQSDAFVAVANFDDDEYGEIVATWYPGMVRLQDDDGTVLWSGSYTGSTIGPPTVADFDNDGEPEIGVAGMGQYVVIDTNGTLLWSRATTDYSSGFTGSAVFDFEGDGQAEAVYADENSLWVYDGATGAVKLEETRHSSATCSESPAIADVDNDGHAEILYSSYPYSGSETGVSVVGDADDSWMPARTIWNQHSYSITNVNDDGTIPAYPETNWATYNNFRSGDLAAATGGAMSDAVPVDLDVCTEECDDGRLRVIVRVGSAGVEALPEGVQWRLYADQSGAWVEVANGSTAGVLEPGESSSGVPVDLSPDDVPGGRLRLVVDDLGGGIGALTECHEENNAVEVEVTGC